MREGAMKKKGLCSRCMNNNSCNFNRKLPVRQCDEFTGKRNTTKESSGAKKKEEQCVGEPAPLE